MDRPTFDGILLQMMQEFEQLKKDVASASTRQLGDVYQLQRQLDKCTLFTMQYSQVCLLSVIESTCF